MVVYAVSGGGYLAFVVYGYRAVEGRRADHRLDVHRGDLGGGAGRVDHARQPALPAAADRDGGRRHRRRRRRARDGALRPRRVPRARPACFVVVVVLVIAATLASALAWSGVGLIAFVPLVGLAVFPLQLAALLVRGLVFEYHRADGARRLPDALSAATPHGAARLVSGARTDHGRGGGGRRRRPARSEPGSAAGRPATIAGSTLRITSATDAPFAIVDERHHQRAATCRSGCSHGVRRRRRPARRRRCRRWSASPAGAPSLMLKARSGGA